MRNNTFAILTGLFCLLIYTKAYSQTDTLDRNVVMPPEEEEAISVMNTDEYPVFHGCEDIKDNTARLDCLNEKMEEFIRKNLRYPEDARKDTIERTINVVFVIDKHGYVKDVELSNIKRVYGYGLEEEAIRVVKSLPRIKPAKQNGTPVSVNYLVPVRFVLK